MADWKQITARIRRARTSKDPAGQLSGLFEKTRDAMVAFELARFFETSGQNSDAAKWYVAAAERFRRADWKTKAQEAAVRVGADISAASADASGGAHPAEAALTESQPPSAPAPEEDHAKPVSDGPDHEAQPEDASAPRAASTLETGDHKRRRRGRRGGRNRRRGEARETTGTSSTRGAASPAQTKLPSASEEPEVAPAHPRFIPPLPPEPAPEFGAASVRARSGDPGLSSRLSVLEMQLRRLLTCPPVKLSEADHAPAGPGVFVLTDSDLTSYYYVEACQTLRVAVGNVLRGGASRRGADSIKPALAEHLGIPESRVAKYLADHCVVRWLQLDEGASHFAHYVTAVIRPTLNE
jgi:hypothetical protein